MYFRQCIRQSLLEMLDLENMLSTSTKLHNITHSILFIHLFVLIYIVNDIISGKYKNTVIVNN